LQARLASGLAVVAGLLVRQRVQRAARYLQQRRRRDRVQVLHLRGASAAHGPRHTRSSDALT